MTTQIELPRGVMILAELQEFASFDFETQRYVCRSLEVAFSDGDVVDRWARSDEEAAVIRAQRYVYRVLSPIRDSVSREGTLAVADELLVSLIGVTSFDLDDLEKIAGILEVPIVELLRRAADPDALNRALTKLHFTGTDDSPETPFRKSASRPSGLLRRDRARPVSAIPANRRRPGWVKSRSPAA